jgi:Outer membrane protein beta-barrel domain
MKKSIAFAVAVIALQALPSFAGETVASSKAVVAPPPPPVESLYRDHEWQIDVFGAYAPSGPDAGRFLGNHAWGGGAGISYFFTRNFGLGLEGSALRGTGERSNHDVSGDFGLNLIGRLPIANSGWAPYEFAGIGGFVPGSGNNVFNTTINGFSRTIRGHNNEDILFQGHVGLGVEYRFTRNIGVFADGRYTFVENWQNDYGLIRTGVRFAF